MVVAIVGMRFVFPILIVMVTAHLPWGTVINDALHHPKVYGDHLDAQSLQGNNDLFTQFARPKQHDT
jgi:hypothetical protein